MPLRQIVVGEATRLSKIECRLSLISHETRLLCPVGPRRKRSLLPKGKPTLGGFLAVRFESEPCSSLQHQFVTAIWDATHVATIKNPLKMLADILSGSKSGFTPLILIALRRETH